MKRNKKKTCQRVVFLLVLVMFLVLGCSDRTPYEKIVSSFTPITIEEVNSNIKKGDPFILYFSRESCSFCNEIVKNVSSAAKEKGVTIHYIDTDTPDLENNEEYVQFRKEHDVEFDPAMLLFTTVGYSKARLITDTDEIALTFKRYLEELSE